MTGQAVAAYLAGTMPRILLIDDDEFVSVTLQQYLAARECEVVVATDREAAELRLVDGTYDLVLVDPYMTGEAHREVGAMITSIRVLQPEAAIVIVSAYTSPQLIAAADANGSSAVLTKPQSVLFVSQLIMTSLRVRRGGSQESLSA